MLSTINRKNKINLADYQYKKEVVNRLFLANLSSGEVNLLQELLFLPSRCSLSDVTSNASCTREELHSALQTFSQIGLTSLDKDQLFIDKELRKYYEFHIEKFTDSFEPSFEYLQGLLNRVPISVLPTWYSIPRTSDSIFSSLVEKYLLTPKIYENYLKELTFQDPLLHSIITDVFASPNLKLETSLLRSRYKIPKEKFAEYTLLLEFHFVLASGFHKGKEALAPFAEWADFLRFQKDHALKPLPSKQIKAIVHAKPVNSQAQAEEAMRQFRAQIDSWYELWSDSIGSIEKSIYELEKSLRVIPSDSWVLFDDFLAGLTAPIGKQAPVTLQRTGKKWRYAIPSYTPKEQKFIEQAIFDLFHKVGITSTGTYQGKRCFLITPFGKVAIGEA